MSSVPFNINDNVRVKLNERGLEIHKNWHDGFLELLPEHVRDKHPYRMPEVDILGYYECQLWSLMEMFGPHIRLGELPPFDTEIFLVVREE